MVDLGILRWSDEAHFWRVILVVRLPHYRQCNACCRTTESWSESRFVAVHPGFEIGWHATAKPNVFWSRLKVSPRNHAQTNGDKGIQESWIGSRKDTGNFKIPGEHGC